MCVCVALKCIDNPGCMGVCELHLPGSATEIVAVCSALVGGVAHALTSRW